MGVGAGASMGSSGVNVGPADGSLQTGDKGTSRSRGEATRGSRYVGEIPVRVVAITPEGLLQVSGMKVIDVDRNKQEMTLSGLVRPQDVDSRDVVESSSIADARLVYISKGLDRPRSGILGRIAGIIWP
jgi:flagellar L-ring protein precursor FlgH